MGAGDYGDLLYAFVYASDDAVPIGAADPKYYIGYPIIGGIKSMPDAPVKTTPNYYASTSRPLGFKLQKRAIWEAPLVIENQALDSSGAYIGMGNVTATLAGTGDTNADYLITLSEDAETPEVIWHEEHNKLSADQAREYYKSKSSKMDVTFEDFLTITHRFDIQREYDMATNLVVRTTVTPVPNGSRAGGTGTTPWVRYPRKHPNLHVLWHTSTFDKYLSGDHSDAAKKALFQNMTFSIENEMAKDPIDDGNNYLPALQARGTWKLDPLGLEFLMDPASTILDDLRLLKDGSTGSAVGDYVEILIPRLHANDYIRIRFLQPILQNVIFSENESEAKEGMALVKVIFQNYTNIEWYERQCTSAGASNKIAAACYEL